MTPSHDSNHPEGQAVTLRNRKEGGILGFVVS